LIQKELYTTKDFAKKAGMTTANSSKFDLSFTDKKPEMQNKIL